MFDRLIFEVQLTDLVAVIAVPNFNLNVIARAGASATKLAEPIMELKAELFGSLQAAY